MQVRVGQAGRDARRQQRKATLGLAALVAAMAVCLFVAVSKDPNPPLVPPPGATGDLDFFRILVECVRSGESYYDAAHREMLAHGYPTRSVFNYRTPIFAWALAALPGPNSGHALLIGCAVLTIALASLDLLGDVRLLGACAGGFVFVGATAWCFGKETYLFTEVWAGLLLALSVSAMRRGWVVVGVVTGLSALFVRELALPYVLVSLAMSARSGRRRETAAWIVGLAFYGAFMAGHSHAALSRLVASDPGMAQGWIRFGGVRFLLTTSQANIFLMGLPLWATAIFLPIAVLGLASWGGETGLRVRATVALYLAAFLVVGAPFNFYWGFVFGPLLALGAAHAPEALVRLLEDAFGLAQTSGSPSGPLVPSV